MSRGPLLALVLALSMVLAGCGGTGGVQTREPFSVPESPPTTTDETGDGPVGIQFSPNPRLDAISDPAVFLDSQSDRLTDTSYALHYEYAVSYANGTVRDGFATSGTFGRDDGLFVANVTTVGEDGVDTTRLLYGNGSSLFVAEGEAGLSGEEANVTLARGPTGAPTDPAGMAVFRGTGPEFVYTVFSAMNVTDVQELDRVPAAVDEQFFRVRAAEVESPEILVEEVVDEPAGTTVENASLEAIVARDGFVYELSFAYTLVRPDGTRLHVSRQLRYRDVGTASVTPPVWLDRNGTVTTARATEPTARPRSVVDVGRSPTLRRVAEFDIAN